MFKKHDMLFINCTVTTEVRVTGNNHTGNGGSDSTSCHVPITEHHVMINPLHIQVHNSEVLFSLLRRRGQSTGSAMIFTPWGRAGEGLWLRFHQRQFGVVHSFLIGSHEPQPKDLLWQKMCW